MAAVTFRFLDLPPEIRNLIYKKLFQSVGTLPQRFHQAPICKVSRELRKESLGLFYEASTFPVYLHRRCLTREEFNWNAGRPLKFLGFSPQCLRFQSAISASRLALIKHLSVTLPEVSGVIDINGMTHDQDLVTWSINLVTGQCIISDKSATIGPNTVYGRRVLGKGGVSATQLQRSLDLIMARDGQNKLRFEDFEAIRVAVHADAVGLM